VPGAASYELTWWPVEVPVARHRRVTTSTSTRLVGLVAGRRYGMTVRAANGGGPGGVSPVSTATAGGPVPRIPRRVTVDRGRGRRIIVTWDAVRQATRYSVHTRPLSSSRWTLQGWSHRPRLLTAPLPAPRRYAVRVRAWHQQVPGRYSRARVVRVH
jgi:hypothetical protein